MANKMGYQDMKANPGQHRMANKVGKSRSGRGHDAKTEVISKHPLSGGKGIWTDTQKSRQGEV